MRLEELEIGDVVYAAHDIVDDGSMPGYEIGDILAYENARGVITMLGHVEEEPTKSVFLVQFENSNLDLGNPIGCFAEDLRVLQD